MLKGINKQIIEIKCTNNEHFEKALLFVRSSSSDAPYEELLRCAEDITCSLGGERPRRSRLWLALPAVSAAAAVLSVIVLLKL